VVVVLMVASTPAWDRFTRRRRGGRRRQVLHPWRVQM